MMFRTAVLATLAAGVSAKSFIPSGEISTQSKIGKKIMEKARALEQDGERDTTWMVNYSIKYLSCSSIPTLNREGNEDEGILYSQNLVKFALCPSDSCGSCTYGDAQYVVNMMDFVDAYTEMKMDEQEQACEYIRENCYCDNANDDEVCENQCYAQAGMDQCIEYEGQEEFEIQRYLECAEMEAANGNNNNNNNNNNNGQNGQNGNYYNNGNANRNWQYYIGPTCSERDGKTINLAVFTDAGCSQKAEDGVYETMNYGNSLPFSSEPIVTLDDCVSCIRQDDNNNNNNNNNNNQNNNGNNGNNGNYNYNYELNELCEQTYEMSAKCESSNLNTYSNYFYPDQSGCNYINTILPKMERATRGTKASGRAAGTSGGRGGAAVAFAIIFFLSTCVLAAYSFFLYRKIHRAKVNLAHSEGMTMA